MKRSALVLLLIQLALPVQQVFSQDLRMLLLPKAGSADSTLLYLSRGLNAIFMTDCYLRWKRYYPCVGITDPVINSVLSG